METKSEVLLKSLDKFYEEAGHFDQLCSILHPPDGQQKISLRMLDWVCCNYSKSRNSLHSAEIDGEVKVFHIYLSYKQQLRALSKKLFDPFARRSKITYRGISTTIGQLAWFRWAISHDLLAFTKTHADDIERDMLESQKRQVAAAAIIPEVSPPSSSAASSSGSSPVKHKEDMLLPTTATTATAQNAKPKRRELSKAAIKGATMASMRITVKFQ